MKGVEQIFGKSSNWRRGKGRPWRRWRLLYFITAGFRGLYTPWELGWSSKVVWSDLIDSNPRHSPYHTVSFIHFPEGKTFASLLFLIRFRTPIISLLQMQEIWARRYRMMTLLAFHFDTYRKREEPSCRSAFFSPCWLLAMRHNRLLKPK